MKVSSHPESEITILLRISIALTLADLDDSGVTAVTAHILRSDLIEQLCRKINLLGILLSAGSFSRNLSHIVKNLEHLSSCMQSGRLILLDFLLYLFVHGNLLAILDFLYALTLSVLLRNLGGNGNGLKVIFLSYSKGNQTFSDLSCFFCSHLSGSYFAVVQKSGNQSSEHSLSLAGSSS